MMSKEKTYRIVAAAIALLLHVGVCLLLLYSYIDYKQQTVEELPKQTTDITFGGEYVALGDLPIPDVDGEPASSATAEEQSTDADDMSDAGAQGEGTSLVSTNAESDMKTTKKKNGPTKEEKEKQAKAKREKERQEKESRKISSNIKNAFGKSAGKGKSGSPNGNSQHGASAAQPGHTLGPGYTLSSWGRPSSGYDGEIYIKVKVNAQGRVTEASYVKGSGAAAANASVRRSCVQASLKSRFSVPKNATGDKVGTIIWKFE